MSKREPVAFWSYVQEDDRHEGGRLTRLRERLEGEMRAQTGAPFPIFQDRNDLQWGESWRSRIESTVNTSSFLIPIVTPSYFRSAACRTEFDTFMRREATLGLNRLILPIYYITSKELETASGIDAVADVLRNRQWADWRELRFYDLDSADMRRRVSELAYSIISAGIDLDGVLDEERDATTPPRYPALDAKVLDPSPVEVSMDQTTLPTPPEATPAPQLTSAVIPVVRTGAFSASRLRSLKKQYEYYAYTTEFDEVLDKPQDLKEPREILLQQASLQASIDANAPLQQLAIGRYAASLSSIGDKPDVVILLDNSGSMRGLTISSVAAWTTIASETLQLAQIPHEVIGFTTRAWKGGKSRERWLDDGRPRRPGRLNDLRYLIYKSFSASYQDALPNFGMMLSEGVLKENIDGEAILFAFDRLASRDARRRLLIVVSDGAPVDDSTQTANPGSFLTKHLLDTVAFVRAQRGYTIRAIGIGHDVGLYYGERDSINISDTRVGKLFVEFIAKSVLEASKKK